MIDGILWALSDGGRWCNLPDRFGPWKTVYDRFRKWSRQGLWDKILRHLQEQYFSLVEVPVAEGNAPALALAQLIGFRQVDAGRRFQK